MAKPRTFDPRAVQRNRALGWDAQRGKAILTSDVVDDDGSLNTPKCEAYGIEPSSVSYLTIVDLDAPYAEGWKQALQAHATATGYSPNDLVWKLVVADAMQDLANRSVAEHRPVTDKALERGISTMMKITGKSREEVERLMGLLK